METFTILGILFFLLNISLILIDFFKNDGERIAKTFLFYFFGIFGYYFIFIYRRLKKRGFKTNAKFMNILSVSCFLFLVAVAWISMYLDQNKIIPYSYVKVIVYISFFAVIFGLPLALLIEPKAKNSKK
ncbi:MAG: hypothetical protein KKF44_08430 [Nanoarchaeota archaeon]|nr:hypothetical protein [Nanoarchaeota archaeon]